MAEHYVVVVQGIDVYAPQQPHQAVVVAVEKSEQLDLNLHPATAIDDRRNQPKGTLRTSKQSTKTAIMPTATAILLRIPAATSRMGVSLA
jgi:hypothetical protein